MRERRVGDRGILTMRERRVGDRGILTMREHHVSVKRTARYVTLGDPSGDVRRVWFVCHGYRQLASRFLRYFAVLDDGHTYVVAPEALSRFYLEDAPGGHGPDAEVGATWMTREDRLKEIDDYVAYLDTLYDRVFARIDREAVSVTSLGFSQGVDTVSRWFAEGRAKVDHLVLWSGMLPGDVDLDAKKSRFEGVRLSIVWGDKDAIAGPSRLAEQERRLKASGVAYDLVRFEGGHHLNKHVLLDLSKG